MVDTIDLSYEEQRRTALVHKLTQGIISLTEAQELRTLPERKRHMLTQQGNCMAFFAQDQMAINIICGLPSNPSFSFSSDSSNNIYI